MLSVIAYEDENDAVRIANDTRYGLSGTVWSSDVERAGRVARRLRTGEVRINGLHTGPNAPLGGFKQSGVGRNYGPFGMDEYTEIQAISGEEHAR